MLLRRALWRWLSWTLLLVTASGLYNTIDLYVDDWYRPFREALEVVIAGWLVLGAPYVWFTLKRLSTPHMDRRDPAMVVLVLLRAIGRNLKNKKLPLAGTGFVLRGPTAQTVWLGLLVKVFFIPVMCSFFVYNAEDILNLFWEATGTAHDHHHDHHGADVLEWTVNNIYLLGSNLIFFVDAGLALLGYCLTSRWLGNGIKSVETTGLGWLVCLACYPPFNDLTSAYLLWPTKEIFALPPSIWLTLGAVVVVLCSGIYLWATMAFGLRFSNLTNRGIIIGGPYRYVRHPAYIAKCLSWWILFLPTFTSALPILFMAGWTVIYWLRAITEERHLSADPEYRLYCQQTRWRFIPGVY